MTPLEFDQHLKYHDCEFMNLTVPDFKHAVYRRKGTELKFTILKECASIKHEVILTCCWFFNIPVPGENTPMTEDEYDRRMQIPKN